MNDELRQELDRVRGMSIYDKMVYIRDLMIFVKQTEDYGPETFNYLYERIMNVTKGYSNDPNR